MPKYVHTTENKTTISIQPLGSAIGFDGAEDRPVWRGNLRTTWGHKAFLTRIEHLSTSTTVISSTPKNVRLRFGAAVSSKKSENPESKSRWNMKMEEASLNKKRHAAGQARRYLLLWAEWKSIERYSSVRILTRMYEFLQDILDKPLKNAEAHSREQRNETTNYSCRVNFAKPENTNVYEDENLDTSINFGRLRNRSTK